MATGQSLLNIMEDLNAELQLQSGETGVAKALRALNAAQDVFETICAQHARILGGTTGTVLTVNNTESTAFPTGLLRLDALWYLDPVTLRPSWKLKPIAETGNHSGNTYWVMGMVNGITSGKPSAYWTDGGSIFWEPNPDGANTIRWYGFKSAADITASGTFAYPDVVIYPLATLASRIIKTSLDDPPTDLISLGKDLLTPLVDTLRNFHRDGAQGLVYERLHDT